MKPKKIIKDCGHKAERKYWFELNDRIFHICEDCHDALFAQMFEQLLLENRTQIGVNVMLSDSIDKLVEEVNKLKEAKNGNTKGSRRIE